MSHSSSQVATDQPARNLLGTGGAILADIALQTLGLAAGMIHPIAATHVTAATATDLLGVY